ncbi:MAG: helix-turn-helix transcriptional regulator [Burkholderiales bacterium]|nr:helix-turn-helix transcriptional regulator [Burkholderiales bacterium]
MKMKLLTIDYQNYLKSNVLPTFQPLIEHNLNSYIINQSLQIESGTHVAAQAFGSTSGNDLSWLNFANYSDEEFLQQLFKQSYTRYGKNWLAFHLKKIVYLQQMVFAKGIIIHPNGEVVAIQAAIIETYILRFQGHIDNHNISTYDKSFYDQFSAREREILFLICNGASQEQMAKILKISSGTIYSIIHNQLSPKFDLRNS